MCINNGMISCLTEFEVSFDPFIDQDDLNKWAGRQ